MPRPLRKLSEPGKPVHDDEHLLGGLDIGAAVSSSFHEGFAKASSEIDAEDVIPTDVPFLEHAVEGDNLGSQWSSRKSKIDAESFSTGMPFLQLQHAASASVDEKLGSQWSARNQLFGSVSQDANSSASAVVVKEWDGLYRTLADPSANAFMGDVAPLSPAHSPLHRAPVTVSEPMDDAPEMMLDHPRIHKPNFQEFENPAMPSDKAMEDLVPISLGASHAAKVRDIVNDLMRGHRVPASNSGSSNVGSWSFEGGEMGEATVFDSREFISDPTLRSDATPASGPSNSTMWSFTMTKLHVLPAKCPGRRPSRTTAQSDEVESKSRTQVWLRSRSRSTSLRRALGNVKSRRSRSRSSKRRSKPRIEFDDNDF